MSFSFPKGNVKSILGVYIEFTEDRSFFAFLTRYFDELMVSSSTSIFLMSSLNGWAKLFLNEKKHRKITMVIFIKNCSNLNIFCI